MANRFLDLEVPQAIALGPDRKTVIGIGFVVGEHRFPSVEQGNAASRSGRSDSETTTGEKGIHGESPWLGKGKSAGSESQIIIRLMAACNSPHC
jgi:hypothetical protein